MHGPDQTSLRSEVTYGWTTAGPLDHPNLAQLLARTLTWRLDLQLSSKDVAGQLGTSSGDVPGLEQTIDLTVALVPAEHDRSSWGVFVRLSGATAASFPIGRARLQSDGSTTPSGWQITIASTDVGAVEMLFPGLAGDLGQSYGFIRGTTSGFTASVAVERPDQVAGSWLIGSTSGTHVEVQHFRAALTFSEDGQGPLLDVSVRTDHVILNIELGGDTFLGAVLPPSLRLDTKIEIGVDTHRGVYLGGGAALVVDLPVTETFGWAGVFDVSLEALHLRLSVTPPASGGDGQAWHVVRRRLHRGHRHQVSAASSRPPSPVSAPPTPSARSRPPAPGSPGRRVRQARPARQMPVRQDPAPPGAGNPACTAPHLTASAWSSPPPWSPAAGSCGTTRSCTSTAAPCRFRSSTSAASASPPSGRSTPACPTPTAPGPCWRS